MSTRGIQADINSYRTLARRVPCNTWHFHWRLSRSQQGTSLHLRLRQLRRWRRRVRCQPLVDQPDCWPSPVCETKKHSLISISQQFIPTRNILSLLVCGHKGNTYRRQVPLALKHIVRKLITDRHPATFLSCRPLLSR